VKRAADIVEMVSANMHSVALFRAWNIVVGPPGSRLGLQSAVRLADSLSADCIKSKLEISEFIS
jgi:hypothetical protein